MVMYCCIRCGFNTHIKTHYIRHLNRKRTCKSIYENIDIETLKNELEGKNIPKTTLPIKSVKIPSNSLNNPSKTLDTDSVQYNLSSTVKVVDGKYQCYACNKLFKKMKYLDEHLKKNCKMIINHNNINCSIFFTNV